MLEFTEIAKEKAKYNLVILKDTDTLKNLDYSTRNIDLVLMNIVDRFDNLKDDILHSVNNSHFKPEDIEEFYCELVDLYVELEYFGDKLFNDIGAYTIMFNGVLSDVKYLMAVKGDNAKTCDFIQLSSLHDDFLRMHMVNMYNVNFLDFKDNDALKEYVEKINIMHSMYKEIMLCKVDDEPVPSHIKLLEVFILSLQNYVIHECSKNDVDMRSVLGDDWEIKPTKVTTN